MKKFFIATVMVLSIVLSMFIGCAKDSGETPDNGGKPGGNSTYTVTYKANAADAEFTETLSNDDKVDKNLPANSKLIAPKISRPGYFLNGWGTVADEARTNLWDFKTNKINSDLVLYAAWLKRHTVSFDYGDGVLAEGRSDAALSIVDGELVDDKSTTFPVVTKDGSIFSGWFSDAGFTKKWNFYSSTVDKNMTLYAKFSVLTQSTENPLFSTIKDEESDTDSLSIVQFNHSLISQNKNAVDLIIPSTLDGKAVTSLGDRAFMPDEVNEGTVQVPNMKPVYQISTIDMADSVVRMGIEVFTYNNDITSITLSDNLTRLGDYAFSSNRFNTVSDIDLSSYTKLVEIGDGAFMKSGIESMILPANLKVIGEHAFDECTALKWVTYSGCAGWNASTMALRLPSTLTRLGEYAFFTSGLTGSVDLGNLTKLTTLERSIFYANAKITSVVLPEGIDGIGTCEFQLCTSLKSVNIPSTVKTIGNWVLFDTAIEFDEANPFVIPEGVTAIGEWNFGKTPNLTCVIIPSTVSAMGTYNFSDNAAGLKVKVKDLTSKPTSWPANWAGGTATVVWGYTGA